MPPNASLLLYGVFCALIGIGVLFMVAGSNNQSRLTGLALTVPALIAAWFAWFAVVTP